MPTPVGHGLGGVACGLLVDRLMPRGGGLSLTTTRAAFIFAALGALPDIDFLFGAHSAYTHSIGATLVLGVAAAAMPRGGLTFGVSAAAAYGSHVLLDWLGRDTVPPIGVMALWPLRAGFYQSDLYWFLPVRREYWLDGFIPHSIRTIGRELAILAPVAVLSALFHRWRRTLAR